MSTVNASKGHMVHGFEKYPATHISRSKFDRSHSLITTMNAGLLVPIWHDLAYPGDTLILSCRTLSRLATQIVPFMSNVYMDVHFWCVPIRLIWEHWVNMHGERPNPDDSIDYMTPQLTIPIGGSPAQSIFDYFNIPNGSAITSSFDVNAFNFRAYNLVYNEDYRDENMINRVPQIIGDTDNYSNYTLLPRGKRKDFFTSVLPAPQKGVAVDLPLGTTAPVIGTGDTLGVIDVNNISGTTGLYGMQNDNTGSYGSFNYLRSSGGLATGFSGFMGVDTDPEKSGLIADLSSATSATINSLRQAFAIQRLLERDNISGTRYIEQILGHFSVKSPDARLQRPEFLGGGTFDLRLNIVPQTSSTDNTSPLGELASYGIINGHTRKIVHSFTEHCVVFGVASIRPEYYYQQGLERDYSRRTRYDYYYPILANLGEEAVLNKEIYVQGDSTVDSDGDVIDNQVFGYQERWSEMRYKNSYITGMTRSTVTTPLDIWHLGVKYNSLPQLNEEFINEDGTVIDRVIATNGFTTDNDGNVIQSNTPQFICNFFFDEKWVRPMPVFSIPSMSAHM